MRKLAMIPALLALALLPSAAVPKESLGPLPALRIECGGGVGTGARYSPTKVVTAAHVALIGGCTVDGEETTVVYADGVLDVAVLRVTPGPVTHKIGCEDLTRGKSYKATGYADGRQLAITTKLVSMGQRFDSDSAPQFNGLSKFKGYTRPGMSGGPITDSRGNLVAIVNTYRSDGAELAMGRAMVDTLLCGVQA